MGIILRTNQLEKIYSSGENAVHALKHVDISIEEGTFNAIIGKSGSGKSTLLHVISGLDHPTSGEVFLEGENIHAMTDKELSALRRQKFGFVFQSYNLLSEFCVEENIKMPLFLDKRPCDEAYIEEIMKSLGILEKRYKFPDELSGGQQQRVALARALANKPRIIFADEPTGNLDKKTGEEVLELLIDTKKRFQQTILLVTHDLDIARLADRVIQIEDGEIKKRLNIFLKICYHNQQLNDWEIEERFLRVRFHI